MHENTSNSGELVKLATTGDVIDALGGNAAVMRLTGANHPQQPSYWRTRGWFPPDRYVVMKAMLKELGYTAPDSLWRMVIIDREAG